MPEMAEETRGALPDLSLGSYSSGTRALSKQIRPIAANLPEMKEACMLEAPYTEDFETMLVSSALDAAIATVHIIEFLETRDRQLAIAVAKLARNSVDLVAQELDAMSPNAPNLEERIRTHVLMQNELYWQERSLAEVASDVDICILESRWRSVPGSLPEINEDNLRSPRAVAMPKRLG
ncbi:hypothetical protein OUZ56_033109 [Daphnia magna]|uniref:Uncharacterized protein n=1 Tax=Daphnia magna TaxID=35525 RepID=A0ABR0BA80_9CRUS|nr:hypothetical protein OUZ56_033109 [Daphnia magna]